MPTLTVRVKSNVPRIREQVAARAGDVIEKAALDVEANAKLRAPVDTGLLRNSIRPERVQRLHWRIVSPVFYSVFQEFGTSRMAAQPYMTPAAEFVRPQLVEAMRRVAR